jgi:SagB-type dehydrogenase family enzyme
MNGDRRPESDRLLQWKAQTNDTQPLLKLRSGCTLQCGLAQALVQRETSFGRFRRDPPLSQEQLAQLLCFVSCSAVHGTDIYKTPRGPSAVRLCLIAQHISGVPRRTYDYDPQSHRLIPNGCGTIDTPLQDLYFMDNYNLDQIAAILVVVGRLECVETAWGSRGLRIMNAESGMVAQRSYLAASALGFGCGAGLGFNAVQMNRLLGIDGESESSILLIFLGHQVPATYAYDFRLY